MHDDELIDRTAHVMTRGEPSPHLRDAVRARIASGGGGLRGPGLAKQARYVWIPALAGVAFVMLAITLPRTVREPRGELVRSTRIASALSVTPPVTLQPAPVSVGHVETPVRVSGPGRTRQQRIVVAPLVIEPISVPLMAVDSTSGVMPIEIEPLQIEPLQPQ